MTIARAALTLGAGLAVACTSIGTGDAVVVFAASSVAVAFDALEIAFEDEHPGIDVRVNLAGSSSLREQILDGAPAGVFVSANEDVMAEVVAAGRLDGDPTTFATNRLVVGVPDDNPGEVTSIADLSRPDLLVGVCAPAVPCGSLALDVLDSLDVDASIDTEEPDVRSLVTKIVAGELDAGVVYASDAFATDEVTAIEIDGDGAVNRYQIGVLEGHDPPADEFVDFVLSDRGRSIMSSFGFGAP